MGWSLKEALKLESHSSNGQVFMPDVQALLDPVIIDKSISHSEARERAKTVLSGAFYLKRFEGPLQEIIKNWRIAA